MNLTSTNSAALHGENEFQVWKWDFFLPIFTKGILAKLNELISESDTSPKHRKNCECCPVSQLIVRSQNLSWIQFLNCQNCSQNVFVFVFVNFFGHVMSSHHSEQMSQRSHVSRIALRRCSQNVFVFVFVNFFWSCHVFSSLWTNVSKVTSL